MHNVPADSAFLAAKFTRLLKEVDVHLLVWDEKKRIEEFIKKYRLEDYKKRIYNGIAKKIDVWSNGSAFLKVFFTNSKARNYLVHGNAKVVLKYLPVFDIVPDIIHFEFGTLANHIADIKKLTAIKTIVSFRGYDLNYVGLQNKEYYNHIWKFADALHFLGNDLRKRAIDRGYKEDKIEALIPPAVDESFFYKEKQDSRNEKFTIVSIGRLTWKKGYEYAIQAMKLLRDKGIDFRYHIVGEGQHRQAIEYAIHENKLEECILLHGGKSPEYIRNVLQSADLFLHPSISEGFSNAVVEAQACGVPVVCTDADGLAENIEVGITGFVVPKWDAEAIADKIEWCMANRTALNDMGMAGVERVQEKFTIDMQVKSFIELYNKVYEG